jgi:hypothetical protein
MYAAADARGATQLAKPHVSFHMRPIWRCDLNPGTTVPDVTNGLGGEVVLLC